MALTGEFPVLSRGNTAEEVASVLREMIMAGTLQPGEQLREEGLSEQFDVSRRTIRDALGVLAHERIVRHYRHKGSRVVHFSEADIRDLYRVRKTLEGSAAQSVKQITEDQLSSVSTAFERLSEASRSGRSADIVRRDLEFHQSIVGLISSPRVNEFFSDIAVEMRYALSILETTYEESKNRPKQALEEHRAIYAAFIDRDVRTARRLVVEHADASEQLLVEALSSADPADV